MTTKHDKFENWPDLDHQQLSYCPLPGKKCYIPPCEHNGGCFGAVNNKLAPYVYGCKILGLVMGQILLLLLKLLSLIWYPLLNIIMDAIFLEQS